MQKIDRTGEEKYNNQGCLMKIVKYNSWRNIIVEFQDEYHYITNARYDHFKNGSIKNLYYPDIFNIGIIGEKYPTRTINGKHTKEYQTWHGVLERSYSIEFKQNNPAYINVTCCKEWLLYENFYEWLHSQENFNKWMLSEKSGIDKDILIKNNKVYSPETCCLVPIRINSLFVKSDYKRGACLIGVTYHPKLNKYEAQCNVTLNGKRKNVYLGIYNQEIDAFYAYKYFKEKLIKNIATEEYILGNITKQCYEAMLSYEVLITD